VGETSSVGTGGSVKQGFGPGTRAARGEPAIEGVTAIAGSAVSSCALTDDGALHCWGISLAGAIADCEGECDEEVIQRVPYPVRVSGFGPAKAFGVDDGHLCIVGRDDTVWCRGFRWDDRLGRAVSGTTPYRVPL
jgi:hypothetical protein